MVDDEVFVGYHTNMHYECVDGLADTVIYSPLQGDQLAVLVEETGSLDSPWSATSEEESGILHTGDLERISLQIQKMQLNIEPLRSAKHNVLRT